MLNIIGSKKEDLTKVFQNTQEEKGSKLKPNHEGPYKVIKRMSNCSYVLEDI